MTDAELVLKARGGDELAFRRLLKRHDGLVYTIVREYFLASGGIEDLKQEALAGFYEAVRDWRPGPGQMSFRSFALLCVRRDVISAIKAASRHKHKPLNESVCAQQPIPGGGNSEAITVEETQAFADPNSDPVDQLAAAEELGVVVGAIRSGLSPLERTAIVGIVEGVPYDQISAFEGVPVKSIDNAAQRARRKIATALEAA